MLEKNMEDGVSFYVLTLNWKSDFDQLLEGVDIVVAA